MVNGKKIKALTPSLRDTPPLEVNCLKILSLFDFLFPFGEGCRGGCSLVRHSEERSSPRRKDEAGGGNWQKTPGGAGEGKIIAFDYGINLQKSINKLYGKKFPILLE